MVRLPGAALLAGARLIGRFPWQEAWRRSSALFAVCLTAVMAGGVRAPVVRHVMAAPPGMRTVLRIEAEQAAQPVALSPATNAPQPLAQLPPVPVRPHEVFGFAPYWLLDAASGFDLHSITTVAYFGVDAGPDGTIQQNGAGWEGYQSQQLVDLIDAAHAAGDRVVLTVKNFDPTQLHQLVRDPQAPGRLATGLTELLRAKSMDGVNLDFEGTDGGDRGLYTAFATAVAKQMKQANSRWQVTADTYGNSAADPTSYMDAQALAPAFDALFVMAYDMYSSDHASPNDSLGADSQILAAYTSVMPAAKVILGLPFYGYDWPTQDGKPFSKATGPPQPVTFGEMQSKGLTAYWDAADDVPWAAYQAGGQWHEIYFDDPTSLSMKARAADSYGVAHVGIWALGFDGNDPAMLAAVHGTAAGVTGPAGPAPAASPHPSPTGSSAPAPQPQPSPSPTGSSGGGGGSLPISSPSPCATPTLGGILPTPLPGCT